MHRLIINHTMIRNTHFKRFHHLEILIKYLSFNYFLKLTILKHCMFRQFLEIFLLQIICRNTSSYPLYMQLALNATFLCNTLFTHCYGLSSVCIRWCRHKDLFPVKHLLQVEHLYGFSPVCIRWCPSK